ncbi:MAG: serine/threonine-protein kinase [Gemmatimonadaceae bacterium]
MATVYRAQDLRLHRSVAIKMLHPALTSEVGVRRFESEVRIAAALLHPNIVGVHDCGEAGGRLYYVMNYLGGETLRARLTSVTQLHVEDALRITEQVAEALQYAHDQNIVHRDIKPENIMLTAHRAYVVDFGLARVVDAIDSERLTASGITIGTPQYLSPEQAEACKNVGPAADQYALACTLYEMLAGEPPFTGPTATAIAMRHVLATPTPIELRRTSTPAAVQVAVMRALRKSPAERFDDIGSFSSSLRVSLHEGGAPRPVGYGASSLLLRRMLRHLLGGPE